VEDDVIIKVVAHAWGEWARAGEPPFNRANAEPFLRRYLRANNFAGDYDAPALGTGC